jgi:hypothetical protein
MMLSNSQASAWARESQGKATAKVRRQALTHSKTCSKVEVAPFHDGPVHVPSSDKHTCPTHTQTQTHIQTHTLFMRMQIPVAVESLVSLVRQR